MCTKVLIEVVIFKILDLNTNIFLHYLYVNIVNKIIINIYAILYEILSYERKQLWYNVRFSINIKPIKIIVYYQMHTFYFNNKKYSNIVGQAALLLFLQTC